MYPQYDQYGRPYYPEPVPDQLAQMRQQNQRPPYQPMQQPDSGILWVQGEAGAKAHLVARGNTVILMDSEQDVFYIKSVDQSGMPSLRVFDYTERMAARPAPQAANQAGEEYLTRREFLEFLDKLQGVNHEPKFAKEG